MGRFECTDTRGVVYIPPLLNVVLLRTLLVVAHVGTGEVDQRYAGDVEFGLERSSVSKGCRRLIAPGCPHDVAVSMLGFNLHH